MKILPWVRKNPHVLIITAFFTCSFIFFTALGLTRFYSFQVFFYDFGIFARILWKLAHFQAPYINHVSLGRVFFLGDHFQPSLVLLAPLFWLTNDLRVLPVEQALATTLSGVMIYLIGRKYNLSWYFSLAITFVFLIFAGIENPLVTDWHPESTAGLFLLLFFYFFAFIKQKYTPYIFAVIFLGFKESNAVTLAFLLLFFFFYLPQRRKEILTLFGVCLVWFFLTTRLLVPSISEKPYLYTPKFAQSLPQLIATITEPAKIRLLSISTISFGFLPLIAGPAVLPVIGEYSLRLLPVEAKYDLTTLGSHYNVFLGTFLALALLYIFHVLKKQKNKKIFSYILLLYVVLISLVSARKIAVSPLNLAINKVFWSELKPNTELSTLISQVPKTGSVMAQNSLLPHLIERDEELYLTTRHYQKILPDIILFDLNPEQNPNNFWSSDGQQLPSVQKRLDNDPRYRRIPTKNSLHYLYVKQK